MNTGAMLPLTKENPHRQEAAGFFAAVGIDFGGVLDAAAHARESGSRSRPRLPSSHSLCSCCLCVDFCPPIPPGEYTRDHWFSGSPVRRAALRCSCVSRCTHKREGKGFPWTSRSFFIPRVSAAWRASTAPADVVRRRRRRRPAEFITTRKGNFFFLGDKSIGRVIYIASQFFFCATLSAFLMFFSIFLFWSMPWSPFLLPHHMLARAIGSAK